MTGGFGKGGRGFLTEEDREWLRGNHASGADDRKSRIKQRFVRLVEDFEILLSANPEDVAELSEVGELFSGIGEPSDSDATNGSDVEAATTNFITMAYILANQQIDYNEIAHNAFKKPGLGTIDASLARKEVLTFYNALSDGIKEGRRHFDDEVPNTVLVAANTRLFLEPTEERIKPTSGSLDTDVWRRNVKHSEGKRSTTAPDDPQSDENGSPSPSETPESIRNQVIMSASAVLREEFGKADEDIKLPIEF